MAVFSGGKGISGKTPAQKLEEVVYVSWEESEKGWGTRPDGCSLHLTKTDFNKFLKKYKKYQDSTPSLAPGEYSIPAGHPVAVYVTPDLYKEIKKSKCGLRLFQHEEREISAKKSLVYGEERSGWVPVERE